MEAVFLFIGAALGWLFARSRTASANAKPPVAESTAAKPPEPTSPAPSPVLPSSASSPDPHGRVRELAKSLADFCDNADQGADLERDPRFVELSALLANAPFTAEDRLNWVTSQTTALSAASIAAMTSAGDDSRRGVSRVVSRMGYLALYFAFRHLAVGNDPEVASVILLRAPRWWTEHPPTRAAFLAFLDGQKARGVRPSVADTNDGGDWDLEDRTDILRPLAHPVVDEFLIDLGNIYRTRRGAREVDRVGRLLTAEENAPVAQTEETRRTAEALKESLLRPGRPSFVLIGPAGVGKTSLARSVLRDLVREGWRVLEASPSQLIAGQKYVGELEQRLESFVDGIGAGRAIWFVPECHQLLEKGTWSGNPHGMLDLLLPYLERGALQLLGESTIAAWSRVIAQRPRVEALMTGLRVEPLGDGETLALVRDWGRQWGERVGQQVLTDDVAIEAAELARQQFPERAEPGRTFELLKEALAGAQRTQPPSLPLDREQLLTALARSSGLPLEILDIGRPLDVAEVRRFFASRVIGQDEAIDCLVDRISMLKAGLSDARRPIGVFLFAGPTGTGKTEVAKTLARYLFGSPDRMLRFDMSEYQSDDAYWRLIDDGEQGRSASLTTRVRQNPFSVILLDEFEKASPRIWDLFLQVFDDGRLTDRGGNTADFRHAIIVLTSNLGSTIAKDSGMGFVGQRAVFSRELVTRAIDTTFRREFINRIDRVVIFNPLTRALMREILGKELRDVLERRGFRGRDWAVEWEPSAIEFLLDKGFTPDLGARPLRRAIDQYLLAPLARTIVEHRVPSGEQFLFVQGEGDSLRVRFVDPDAPSDAPVASAPAPADLRALALEPRLDRDNLSMLRREIDARAERTASAEWQALKDNAASAMQRVDFWQRPERQAVLDRLERMDRIESGLRAANSLHGRLSRSGGRGAGDFVRRAALLVAAIDRAIVAILADEPEDARLEIKPAEPRSPLCLAWRDRIAQMYQDWGDGRGMRIERSAPDASSVVALDVYGFGAYQALRDEAGTHVLESRVGDRDVRHSVRVSVVPDTSATQGRSADVETRLCRRYDDGPSPLVRDLVHGWRSGRIDRILAGDFDLMAGAE